MIHVLCSSSVTRSFRYRLRPSREQERTLLAWLTLTRELYNAALAERRDAWATALAKSVNDAAWSTFRHWLACKAEDAGRQVVEVNPRGTSQSCSSCGVVAVEKLSLSVRTFRCGCGLTLDRDVNAARNIKGARLGPAGSRARSRATA